MYSDVEHVAKALMKVWFPKMHNDNAWLESEDGSNWLDISLADAEVAIKAYNEWLVLHGEDDS